jgi:hypothetical protein
MVQILQIVIAFPLHYLSRAFTQEFFGFLFIEEKIPMKPNAQPQVKMLISSQTFAAYLKQPSAWDVLSEENSFLLQTSWKLL